MTNFCGENLFIILLMVNILRRNDKLKVTGQVNDFIGFITVVLMVVEKIIWVFGRLHNLS